MAALPCVRSFAGSAAFACACLGVSVVVLGVVTKERPSLAAASNSSRADLDRDGLTDQQEIVIGTLPQKKDSDGDTYSDLEERARGSDPRDATSVPDPANYSIGTAASQEDGYVTMLTVVYAHGNALATADLKLGLVYRGHPFLFLPHKLQPSRGFLFRGRDAGDSLAVVEIGVQVDLARRLGQLNLFSLLSSTTPGAETLVSIVPVVDNSGIAMLVEQGPVGISNGGGGPAGVTYRPLAADDQIPSTWNAGQMCFQATSAVGMRGVSIVHEIEASDCLPMDTYCSPAACSSGVGSALELPDPAALAGG